LAGAGVCRDYAHLVIASLRALSVPARLVAVYAPGCQPMDFHAVAESFVDGAWRVVDATCLAPRQSMVRIATERRRRYGLPGQPQRRRHVDKRNRHRGGGRRATQRFG
jgi:transglutaminase-like putative cysteine protease